MADVKLKLTTIPVVFADGARSTARAEGNSAAWHCICGDEMPLVGRCYFQYGHDCHTECPSCSRVYRVTRDESKKAISVEESNGSC